MVSPLRKAPPCGPQDPQALASSPDADPATLLPGFVLGTGDSMGLVIWVWLSDPQRNPLQTWTHQEEGISEIKISPVCSPPLLPKSTSFIYTALEMCPRSTGNKSPDPRVTLPGSTSPAASLLATWASWLTTMPQFLHCEAETMITSTSLGCWKELTS